MHAACPALPAAAAPPPVSRARWLVMPLLFLLPAVLLWQSGALPSDLSGDPDEAAHAVTALMVRDYAAGAAGTHPLAFARAYYEAYPKVALGHYPPGYYAVTALFLLAAPAVSTLLWVQAGTLTLIGLLVWRFCREEAALQRVAAPASLAVVGLPPLLKTLVLVMADLMLAVWCLLAVLAWARFLRAPRWQWSLAFGLAAAGAVLTKGSGLLLGAVPLISTLLAGKAALLRKPAWWLGALPVAVLAGPWMWFTAEITKEGMIDTGTGAFFVQAAAFYARNLPHSAGWLLTLLGGGLALPLTLAAIVRRRPLNTTEAALWGWLLGGALLLLLIPAGLTNRYLVPLLPPLLLLVFAHASRLAAAPSWLPWVLSLLILAETARPPYKNLAGFRQAAAQLLATPRPGDAGRRWLVASDARGEGALIAAVCFGLTPQERLARDTRLLRGSKALASSDWLGRGYEALAADPAGMTRLLAELLVDHVLLDESIPPEKQPAHLRLLAQTLRQPASGWRRAASFPVRRAEGLTEEGLLLFARGAAPGP